LRGDQAGQRDQFIDTLGKVEKEKDMQCAVPVTAKTLD
jgi:hypothetical protein